MDRRPGLDDFLTEVEVGRRTVEGRVPLSRDGDGGADPPGVLCVLVAPHRPGDGTDVHATGFGLFTSACSSVRKPGSAWVRRSSTAASSATRLALAGPSSTLAKAVIASLAWSAAKRFRSLTTSRAGAPAPSTAWSSGLSEALPTSAAATAPTVNDTGSTTLRSFRRRGHLVRRSLS